MSESLNFPTVMPSLLLDFANRKSLDPRITFTRASTATYYDEDTVAKAEENLLTYSQEFDNAVWSKSLITAAANTSVAPDGTTTADKLVQNNGVTAGTITQVFSGALGLTAYTYSVFLKADGFNNTRVILMSRTSANVFVSEIRVDIDLSSGTLSNQSAGTFTSAAYTATAVGNGWYRVSINGVSPSTTGIFWCRINNLDLGDGTNGILAWGAQLEQRSAVTAYTPTTTAPITNYIPVLMTAAVGVPRFDFNPTTRESLGLLIEEQRTNLLTYSSQFDNAAWTKSNSSITANTIVAPDGTLTGDKLVENTATAEHRTDQAFTFSAGLSYVFSFYAKAAERTFLAASLRHNGSDNGAFINLTTGAISAFGSATTVVTDVGNGWWRISIAGTSATASTAYVRISLASSISTTTYTGNGFSGVYIWGAQLEAGAFPTSYIPTVASSATRSADAASMTGVNFSEWYKASEGTLYAEVIRNGSSMTSAFIGDGSLNNYIGLYTNTSGIAISQILANGVSQASWSIGATVSGISYKNILSYKTNDIAYVFNGGTINSDTSAIVPIVSALYISAFGNGGGTGNGTIKKIAYYPWRLTNAQLQALTS